MTLRTKPEGARIFHNGTRVGNSPFTVELPRGKSRRYAVWLDGYGTRSVLVDGSQTEILLGLNPEAKTAD